MKRILFINLILLFCLTTCEAAQFIVNSTSDANSGAGNTGTLRYCITQANLTAAKDTITFSLTGGGPYTLTVATNYPVISQPLYINGTSQAGTVQGQLGTGTRVMEVILNGPGNSTVYGFQITASNSSISGLVIQNFYKGIYINGASNCWIWGCYVGTSNTGLAISAATTCWDDGIGLANNANNNIIGTNGDGTNDANEGNLVAGNGDSGTQYSGECIVLNEGGTITNNCSGNWIAGNFLGTNETGTSALYPFAGTAAHQRGSGIQLNFCTGNTIGTNADGVSDVLERNVISGNSDEGIVFVGSSSNKIKGNYIGVDKTGNVGLPNYIDGGTALSTGQIVLKSSSNNNFIGTDGDGVNDAVEGNVIGSATLAGVAASYSDGIDIILTSTGNRISGNKIGIGANGTSAVNILTSGVVVNDWAVNINSDNNIVGTNGDGTSDALEANYIGNSGSGVVINGCTGTVVAGNYIGLGTNLTTSEPLSYAGVYVFDPTGTNRVGSSASNSLEINYLCNSTLYGLWADGNATANNDLINIRYNTIGMRPDGTAAPNAQYGIYIYNLSNADTVQYNTITRNGTAAATGTYSGIQIGSSVAGTQSSGNVIHNNTIYKNIGPGINIVNSSSLTNKISQNSIYDNGNGADATGKLKLGIDLGADGVTANDNLDPDTGPNGLTNFPIITGVTTNTSCVATISGTYNGLASTSFIVEVFSSDVCNGDTSGVDYIGNAANYGEGKTYLGTTAGFTTNASGNGAWSMTITLSAAGKYLTAVAIQTSGAATASTSEFSQCYSMAADFGDAPDTYGTLLASCGAEHLNVSANLRIGALLPDTESDGQPTVNADGDGADEDGLSYPLPNLNTLSTTYSLTNIAVKNSTGTAATLYGWIDFNGNGSFEATEFTSVAVPSTGAQTVTLTWNLSSLTCSSSLVAGISYIRLRLTTDVLADNVATTTVDERSKGVASNGEVEDYRITILPVDFGDCPNTYPIAVAAVQYDTTSGKVWAGVNKPGIECTQKYSSDATGDGLEEDGLTTSTGALGSTYTWVIKLNSNLASKTVFYGLWIDWDANQNFTSAMDAFYSGSVVTNGPTTTNVSVLMPLGSSSHAFMRLMASASAVTSGMYNSTITNGEIEDYSLFYILSDYSITLSGSRQLNSNSLLWTVNNAADGHFVIQRSEDSFIWNDVTSLTSANPATTHFNYEDNDPLRKAYYYRIKYVSSQNITAFSNTIFLEPVNRFTSIQLYPNPANNVIHIKTGASSFNKLIITDIAGRNEYEQPVNSASIDVDISKLATGTHIARLISSDGKEQLQKFLKYNK